MFNVTSTQRAKRIARDLQAVLADLGRPLGYSGCLEMSAHLLGFPSYGMLSRRAGGSAPTADDDASSPAEAAARRAHQTGVLLQAGLHSDIHDAILRRVRPTARSKARGPVASGTFGCAWFDADDRSGWSCIAGGEPIRFSDHRELDAGVTWWTTLDYGQRYRTASYPPNILTDRHLTLSPLSAVREHGLDLSESGSAKAAAAYAADVLGRARRVSDACISADAHKSLISAFEVGWGRNHGTDDIQGKPTEVWEEFIATSVRGHWRGCTIVSRQPRLDYARSMMDAQIPTGPYQHVDLAGNPSRAMRLRFVRDNPDVAFVYVRPPARPEQRCPIRGAFWHTKAEPAWYARPVYQLLLESMDVAPEAVMLAPDWRRAGEFMPGAASRFLKEADGGSWADGIVAEAIWRSGLSGTRTGSGSWQHSFAGTYMRAVDQARMCAEAVRLQAEGMAVSSFGLGWVRYTRPAS